METTVLLVVLLVAVLALVVLLLNLGRKMSELKNVKPDLGNDFSQLRQELSTTISSQVSALSQTISTAQQSSATIQKDALDNLDKNLNTLRADLTATQENLRKSVDENLKNIREGNDRQLGEIRQTVDEKLQKTLEDKMTNSFKMVSERLEQVYKGLGEMQTLATSVGDLKKVLSNTKTRGIVGEIQLEAILQEILTPDQYDKDIATRPGSSERVEFAIKLPGNQAGENVYLPIDAKFPGDSYAALQDAYLTGDKQQIDEAYKHLETFIKMSAKTIREKYIEPPYTTNFAIMFLPFEGLYAEVVNRNLIEILQRDYSVNIAGPSTMAAMLNALQMGFRTLQIQKRSDEVWKTLSAVKTEFETFGSVFKKAQERIKQLDQEMDKLVGTRSRAIERKLRGVQSIDLSEADRIVDIQGEDLMALD